MKHVLSLLAYLLNRKFNNLSLVTVKNDRRVPQGVCLIREQSFVNWHLRRAIPVVVSPIDRTSVFAVEPCSVGTKRYQTRQRLGASLKIDVVRFAHSSWKLQLPSSRSG